jgi:hypothetical protein
MTANRFSTGQVNTRSLARWCSYVLLFALGAAANLGFAVAATVATLHQAGTGQSAHADWSQSDGCIQSGASVDAGQAMTSGGNSSQFASVSIFVDNSCTNTETFGGGDTTSGIKFSSQGASGATVTGTIPAIICFFDFNNFIFTCSNHSIAVNVSWSATGPATHTQLVIHRESPTGNFEENIVGSMAPATSSGSITVDGGPNLIPGNSQDGQLSTGTTGTITVSHPH